MAKDDGGNGNGGSRDVRHMGFLATLVEIAEKEGRGDPPDEMVDQYVDCQGKMRVFRLKEYAVPTGAVLEAVEERDGESAGWRFQFHFNPETDVPVTVVRIPVVAGGAARVPLIVVERAAAHHTGGGFDPAPLPVNGRFLTSFEMTSFRVKRGIYRLLSTVSFVQPPKRRPISATIPAACSYCPAVNHSQRAASRR